jgi:single-strand DNA-binding protein
MSGLNKVQIIGRLGGDPEVRFTSGGSAVGNFNVATSETFKDKNGEKHETTEWHRMVVWGKTAELCRDYLQKGSLAYFEGSLKTREWEDKNGAKQRTTEIHVQNVQFLSPKADGARSQPQQQRQQPKPKQDDPNSYGPPPMGDDDIPF